MLDTIENQAWWGTPEILAFRKRQEVQEFKVIPGYIGMFKTSLGYTMRPCSFPCAALPPPKKKFCPTQSRPSFKKHCGVYERAPLGVLLDHLTHLSPLLDHSTGWGAWKHEFRVCGSQFLVSNEKATLVTYNINTSLTLRYLHSRTKPITTGLERRLSNYRHYWLLFQRILLNSQHPNGSWFTCVNTCVRVNMQHVCLPVEVWGWSLASFLIKSLPYSARQALSNEPRTHGCG